MAPQQPFAEWQKLPTRLRTPRCAFVCTGNSVWVAPESCCGSYQAPPIVASLALSATDIHVHRDKTGGRCTRWPGAVQRCKAPSTSLRFSLALLLQLERVGATFPGPAPRNRPFDPTTVLIFWALRAPAADRVVRRRRAKRTMEQGKVHSGRRVLEGPAPWAQDDNADECAVGAYQRLHHVSGAVRIDLTGAR